MVESKRGNKRKKHRYMRGGMMFDQYPTEADEAEYLEFVQEARHPHEDPLEEMLRRKKELESNRKNNIEQWVSSVCGNIPEGWNDNINLLLNHLIKCLNSPDMKWQEPYQALIVDLKYKTQDLINRHPKAKDGLNTKMSRLEQLIKTKKLAAERAEKEALEPAPAPAPLSLDQSDIGSLEDIADFDELSAMPESKISIPSHQLLRYDPKWQGGKNCGPAPDYLCGAALDFQGNPLSSRSCMICGVGFTFMVQKHHCRRCGISVCNGCSREKIKLTRYLSDNKPHLYDTYREKEVRVCNLCYYMETNPHSDSVFSPLSFTGHKVEGAVAGAGSRSESQVEFDDLLARLEAVKNTAIGGGKSKFKRRKTQKSRKKSKRRKTYKRKSKKKRRNKTKRK